MQHPDPRYPELPEQGSSTPVQQVAELRTWLRELWDDETTAEIMDRQWVLERIGERLDEIDLTPSGNEPGS